MRIENHIPLLAGLCAGTACGVPLGPLIQKSTDGNLFPDRGEHDKAWVIVSHSYLTGLRALRHRRGRFLSRGFIKLHHMDDSADLAAFPHSRDMSDKKRRGERNGPALEYTRLCPTQAALALTQTQLLHVRWL